MALPVVNTPTFIFNSHTLKKDIEYRPFNLGEEKVLSTITNSNDNKEIAVNIKKVVQSCVLTPEINVGKLYSYDVELLLLKIRGKSAGEEVRIMIEHPKTKEKEEVVINLDEVNIQHDENHDHKIEVNKDLILLMKDLTFDEQLEIQSSSKDQNEAAFDAMIKCVKGIYDKRDDKTYTVGENTTEKEIEEFILKLNGMVQKISEFFKTTPRLMYEITFKDGEKLEITNFKDFLA